ncbi:MAG: BatA domain-containing protein [Bacteroidota bacterium]
MTFLNPLVLFGLLAASIPILLHLFNLRKLKTIEFSTLSFLKELQKTKIRRLKIRQLLLLVLRTLLVILVVMAFSRPTLKGGFSESARARTTAVFIVDDSYSMTSADAGGELLKQAKQAALRALEIFEDGDEVFLLRISDAVSHTAGNEQAPYRNFEALRSALNAIKPSYTHHKLEDALRVSARLLDASKNFNREVFVFSDFQAGLLSEQAPQVKESLFASGVRLFLLPVGNREVRNLSVDAVTIPNAILEPGKPFTLIAKVTNHTAGEIKNTLASVFASNTRVAQKGISLGAHESANVELSVVPRTTGYFEGFVSLEDDDLEFDNRRFFTVYIPSAMNVLLVGSSTDVKYIQLALVTRTQSDSSQLTLTEVTSDRLTTSHINSADVIVLSGALGLSPTHLERVRSAVEKGTGLMVFPGSSTTPQNSVPLSSLRLPNMISVEGNPRSLSFLEFDKTDMRHPLFTGMFDEQNEQRRTRPGSAKQKTIESPKVKVFVRYAISPTAQPVITLTNGASFLLEQKVGGGKVLLFAVAPHLEWSDFPVKGLFVPLLHRSLSYLVQDPSKVEPFLAGQDVVVRHIQSTGTRFTVRDPSAGETSHQAVVRGSDKTIHFSEAMIPGIYTVRAGSDVVRKFAVNVDPDESRTKKAEEPALLRAAETLGIGSSAVHTINNVFQVQQMVRESRYGIELWKHMLIAALLVAVVEMFVARDTKRGLAEYAPRAA